jgi:sugar-specific transcriptional regulator TrmB
MTACSERMSLGEALAELGIAPPTARLYITLLRGGPERADRLAAAVSLPAYETATRLRQLEAHGLIGSDVDAKQRRYYAKDPDEAWTTIIATLVWSARSTIGPIRALPATNDPDVDRLRRLCDIASAEAKRLYQRRHDSVSRHRVRDAYSSDELASLTCELIAKARREVVAVSATGSGRLPHVAEFWVALQGRMSAGVKYRRIVDLQELIDHGLDIVQRDIEEAGVDLRVIEASAIDNNFYVVDKHSLSRHEPGAAVAGQRGPTETPVGRVTNNGAIARRYHRRFEELYRRSLPGAAVLAELRDSAAELVARARTLVGADEVAYLEDIICMGKFTTFPRDRRWSAARGGAAMRALQDHDLAGMNVHGELVPRYPITESELRARTAPAND